MTNALRTAEILLPRHGLEYMKWAVLACDQFTSQPEYWAEVDRIVGDAPSALRLTLPEAWLGESDARVPEIHAAMRRYLDEGILMTAVRDGFVLVERTTPAGVRPGLLAALDLEAYDFNPGSQSLIRATEGTVLDRLPPRVKIRTGAPVELPHVMMLIDDPMRTLIEPLHARAGAFRMLYDFDLMEDGGHIRGWAIEGPTVQPVYDAIDALLSRCDGLLYAVGDGNHSLAAARQCWLELREQLPPEQRENHPARFALVELVNLACPALKFEPIHRVLKHVRPASVIKAWKAFLADNGADEGEGDDLIAFDANHEWRFRSTQHPLRLLTAFLDDYLARHPDAEVDYIHGEDALRQLVGEGKDAMGFMPRAFEKSELFDYVRQWGALPRKTFSMGEAREKRYYLEARRIM